LVNKALCVIGVSQVLTILLIYELLEKKSPFFFKIDPNQSIKFKKMTKCLFISITDIQRLLDLQYVSK